MVVHVIIALAGLALGSGSGWALARHLRSRGANGAGRVRTILLPFTGEAIPRRALDAALRLARAEDATLMPAFLVTVPRQLPLDASAPLACEFGMPVLEAIEQVATSAEVLILRPDFEDHLRVTSDVVKGHF